MQNPISLRVCLCSAALSAAKCKVFSLSSRWMPRKAASAECKEQRDRCPRVTSASPGQSIPAGAEGPEGTKGSFSASPWEEKQFGMRCGSPGGRCLSGASSAALPSLLELLCACPTAWSCSRTAPETASLTGACSELLLRQLLSARTYPELLLRQLLSLEPAQSSPELPRAAAAGQGCARSPSSSSPQHPGPGSPLTPGAPRSALNPACSAGLGSAELELCPGVRGEFGSFHLIPRGSSSCSSPPAPELSWDFH